MSSNLILESIDELLALGSPEEAVLATAATDELIEAVVRFRGLWLNLLEIGGSLPDGRSQASQLELFEQLLIVIGDHLDYAANRILNAEDYDESCDTAFALVDLDRIVKVVVTIGARIDSGAEVQPIDVAILFAGYLLTNYVLYLGAAAALRMTASQAIPASAARALDRQLLVSLAHMADRLDAAPVVGSLVLRIVKAGMLQASRIASDRVGEAGTDGSRRFSLIRPQDLAPLAARDETLTRFYGEKKLESMFEEQLDCIFRSFGLVVIPERPGERSVDLICLSDDSHNRTAFLVDGKTTRGYYSLSARDERALIEYVNTVERSMRTMPAPDLLLLVGPRGSKNLAGKLKKLRGQIRPEVRFMSAGLLGSLRELTLGAIPAELLVRALIAEPFIVGDSFPSKLALRVEEVQVAHQALVRSVSQAWKH